MNLSFFRRLFFCAVGAIASNAVAPSASGVTYQPDSGFSAHFDGFSGAVYVVTPAPDGGFYAGGDFASIAGGRRRGVAKFKADGTLDPAFDVEGGFDGWVTAIAVQPDGRLLVGGMFERVNGVPRIGLARLNTDGSLDTSFNVADATYLRLDTIVVQPDGRILVEGSFPGFSDDLHRLNTDGSRDTTFDTGTGFDGFVSEFVLDANGRILVGGSFSTYQDEPCGRLIRLNADGSRDVSFSPEISQTVEALVVQSDGRIVVVRSEQFLEGGWSYAGSTGWDTPEPLLISRYFPDGTEDTGFVSDLYSYRFFGVGRTTMVSQPDGGVVLTGGFWKEGAADLGGVVRLHSDGSLDESFRPVFVSDYPPTFTAIVSQADGRILLSVQLHNENGGFPGGVARLTSEGVVELAPDQQALSAGDVYKVAPLTDGKWLVAGAFAFVNGVPQSGIARLNANGSLDTSFDVNAGFFGDVFDFALQPDGKVVAVGSFTSYDGTACKGIVRLNTNGTVDDCFLTGSGFNSPVYAITLQAGNNIIAAGDFSSYNFANCPHIARLTPNGILDPNFNPPAGGLGGAVHSLELQSDGRVLAAGAFSGEYASRPGLVRLNTTGSIDNSFDSSAAFDGIDFHGRHLLAPQIDGRIFVAGFDRFFVDRPAARLNGNGSLDAAFQADPNILGNTTSLVVETTGRVILGGNFHTVFGTDFDVMVRLNSNGTRDNSFAVNGVTAGYVYEIVPLADGRLLLAGASAGATQTGVVLLTATPETQSTEPAASGGGGGAVSAWCLMALLCLAAMRRSAAALRK